MTERQPPGINFESWVDRQIREAAERGAFDDLAGTGKPLPDLDRRDHQRVHTPASPARPRLRRQVIRVKDESAKYVARYAPLKHRKEGKWRDIPAPPSLTPLFERLPIRNQTGG